MTIEARILVAGIIGIFGTTTLKLLWNLLTSPFAIIQEQDEIITGHEILTDQKANISRAWDLFRDGTSIRNRGERLVSKKSVPGWKIDFLTWKYNTMKALNLIDRNKALAWRTLGLYEVRRNFPQAFTVDHHKQLQNFDGYLTELQKILNELDKENKNASPQATALHGSV